MRIRKWIYILLLVTLVLTACGKVESGKKDREVVAQEDNQKTDDSVDNSQKSDEAESDENSDTTQSDEGKTTSTEKETVSVSEKKETSNNEQNTTGSSNKTPSSNAGSNTQKPSNGSTTKPSNGSVNTGGTSNTGSNNSSNTGSSTTKKPVKRVSEEVKSAVVPYKYGITKYDMTTNYYTLFSDNSKELLYSDSYTVYDTSNYSATDSQLKSEADSNASKYMSYYQEILRLVNEIRATAGVAPLTLDTTLCKAASMRAVEMDYSNQMSHTRPSGKDCFSVLDFYGISFGTCGENIAAGQTSASSVVNGWKNSPGHYQNMINASYTKLGVGYSAMGVGDYGHYWCQLFTN